MTGTTRSISLVSKRRCSRLKELTHVFEATFVKPLKHVSSFQLLRSRDLQIRQGVSDTDAEGSTRGESPLKPMKSRSGSSFAFARGISKVCSFISKSKRAQYPPRIDGKTLFDHVLVVVVQRQGKSLSDHFHSPPHMGRCRQPRARLLQT